MKHFISLLDYSNEELMDTLNRADFLAEAWRENRMPNSLKNMQIGLWFYGNGFRNRLAFEIGLKSMGASISYIPGELGKDEPLEDIGPYLANWYSMLIVRARSHNDLLYLSKTAEIPIVNARTEFSHPCEVMGDLQFIRKYRGSLDELKVVFVGEVSNLCMSWFEAAARFPIRVTQIAPKGYGGDEKLVKRLNANGIGKIITSDDLDANIENADLVYTDCWPRAVNLEDSERINTQFLPYQITKGHLSRLHRKAIFLPCPPVTRGQEVSADAMDSELCKNFDAKAYLLHSQNAIVEMIR